MATCNWRRDLILDSGLKMASNITFMILYLTFLVLLVSLGPHHVYHARQQGQLGR